MHLIHARDLPMSDRRPRVIAYIAQARRALLDPSLPLAQREKLKRQIARLQRDMQEATEGRE